MYLGGWFQIFFCSSLFGEDPHFDSYFSNGLKPPIRYRVPQMKARARAQFPSQVVILQKLPLFFCETISPEKFQKQIVSGDFWQNFAHGNDNSSDDLTSTYPSTGDLKGGIPQPFPGSPNKTITTKPSFGKRNVWFFPTIEQAHLSQERQEMYRMIRNHFVAFDIWHHRVIFLSIKHRSSRSKISWKEIHLKQCLYRGAWTTDGRRCDRWGSVWVKLLSTQKPLGYGL